MVLLRNIYSHHEADLSPRLQNILFRNGLQAHVGIGKNGKYQLIVIGHDSPVLKYELTDRQLMDISGRGSDYANKTAYNTLCKIIGKDFDMPMSYAMADGANCGVSMGQHGYVIGPGEYGRPNRRPFYTPFSRFTMGWGGSFLGWTPRHQPGWHTRRIDGRVFLADPIVPVRPDGRVRAGEMFSGGYGFYYKGNQKGTQQDVLDDIEINDHIKPLQAAPRPEGQGISYSDHITSDVYFTNDKWQEVLASHGIVIDAEKKTMTIQARQTKVDVAYSLTDDELKKLTNNSVMKRKGGVTVQERLDIINNIISRDFNIPISKEMLELKDLVNLDFKPEVKRDLEAKFIEREQQMAEKQMMENAVQTTAYNEYSRKADIASKENAVDGAQIGAIIKNRGWFRDVDNGREVAVGEIRVKKNLIGQPYMEAEINGEWVSKKISDKDYDKFLAVNDERRLKMFDKLFDEVSIGKVDKQYRNDELYMSGDSEQSKRGGRGEWRPLDFKKGELADIASNELYNAQVVINKIPDSHIMQVGNIKAYNYNDMVTAADRHGIHITVAAKDEEGFKNNFYKLVAVVDGQTVAKTISAQMYQRFQKATEEGKLALFNEVWDINDPSMTQRTFERKELVAERILQKERSKDNTVDGRTLDGKKGFFREGKDGREVIVGQISVEKVTNDKYKMTAVINGHAVTHEISGKDYDKFLAVNDEQRMKLFAKIFKEVDIKSRPHTSSGENIGAAVLAAFTTAANVAADVHDAIHHPSPEIYASHTINVSELAAASYDSQFIGQDDSQHNGRGMSV